jgi:hypothetical protein
MDQRVKHLENYTSQNVKVVSLKLVFKPGVLKTFFLCVCHGPL